MVIRRVLEGREVMSSNASFIGRRTRPSIASAHVEASAAGMSKWINR